MSVISWMVEYGDDDSVEVDAKSSQWGDVALLGGRCLGGSWSIMRGV